MDYRDYPDEDDLDYTEDDQDKSEIKEAVGAIVQLVVIAAVFIVSIGLILKGVSKDFEDWNAERKYKSIRATFDEEQNDPMKPANAPVEKYEPPDILNELVEKNSDVVGYLVIDNTDISYPVVQAPATKENDWYLHRDLDGNESNPGSLFLQQGQYANFGYLHTIYGHNMKNGTMFGTFQKWDSKEYRASHKTAHFYTLKIKYDLELVSFLEFPETTAVTRNAATEEEAGDDLSEAFRETFDPDGYFVLVTCMYMRDKDRGYLIFKDVTDNNQGNGLTEDGSK